MLVALLKAPVRVFDTNPAGRILNRFSKDIGIMDESLPEDLYQSIRYVYYCSLVLVLVSVVNYWVVLASVPTVVLAFYLTRYYLRASREVKRLEAIASSPVYAHFTDTIQGIVHVRTYKQQNAFIRKLYRLGLSTNYVEMSCGRFKASRLETCFAIGCCMYVCMYVCYTITWPCLRTGT